MKRKHFFTFFVSLFLSIPVWILLHLLLPKYTGKISVEEKGSKFAFHIDLNKDGALEKIQFQNINGKEQLYCEVWTTESMLGIWQRPAHLIKKTLKAKDIDGDQVPEMLFYSVEGDTIFANAVSLKILDDTLQAQQLKKIYITHTNDDFDAFSFQTETIDMNHDGVPELLSILNYGPTIRGLYETNFITGEIRSFESPFIHWTGFYLDTFNQKPRIILTSYANGNIPQTKVKLAAERYGADTSKAASYLSDWNTYILLLDDQLRVVAGPLGKEKMFGMSRAMTVDWEGEKCILNLITGINDDDTLSHIQIYDSGLNIIKQDSLLLNYNRTLVSKYHPRVLNKIGSGKEEKVIYVAQNDSIYEITKGTLQLTFLTFFPEVRSGAGIRDFDLDRDGIAEVIFSVENGLYITRPDLTDGIFLFTEGQIDLFADLEYGSNAQGIQGVRVHSGSTYYFISYRFNSWWYAKWIGIPVSLIVLFLVLVMWQKVQSKKLEEQNRHLEWLVSERTREISHQKELVEEKQKEIMDSITYAKRIQEAILPSRYSMVEHLKNGFVLYKPKDIVAGDFYWLERQGNFVFVAAADCTGHGVPGAMVSVICSNALSKSLLEENIIDTGALLNRTRELVIGQLSKSGGQVKDGMDVSLLRIDYENNSIQWSGANNPLWIFRDGELEEVKPDKQPIGVFENAVPFTTHTRSFSSGSTFYLFTDGFQDQFGGEKGKKYKAARLRTILSSIQALNMDEQKQMLDRDFELWKGDLEQNDDVCLIGIRF